MTIQRKYSLPNCTLILEGLSDSTTNLRPPISILVNAECRFNNSQQPSLSGGRDFFESLVRAVSAYAQEFLSQVHHPKAHKNQLGLVQLQKIDNNRHRLTVQSATGESKLEAGANSSQSATAIDLTTVQLFDLVEAVDQFFADSQTLPELSLKLTPVSKRYAGSQEPLVKQAVPAAVGVSSLALAAIAFFLVPIPEVKPPEPKPQSSSSQSTPAPVAEITEPTQVNDLRQKLENQLNQAWDTRSAVKQDLTYRVVVNPNGAIVGYKSISATSNDDIEQTPLPKLLYNPAANRTITQEAIAQFKVVFTNNGEVQVSPWQGDNSSSKK